LPAVATVMVLANWDHHYDLDKEVHVLTIPQDSLLFVLVSLVAAFILGLMSFYDKIYACLPLRIFLKMPNRCTLQLCGDGTYYIGVS
jgi:hypothetical protein